MVEMKIGKLRPNVPIKNSMSSMAFRSGRFQTYRKPSARLPRRSVGSVRAMKFIDPQQTQRAENGGKRGRVDQEDPPRANRGDEDTRDRRDQSCARR